ncbi:LysR family transcriptional regulator [Kutzneria sp. NPDC052558]|uniref:LysR family transcriptional regulator n=1 Tax=Kutzneria sp. NPDC052558 TaxID=3364121 RepID=UPI0037CBA3D8
MLDVRKLIMLRAVAAEGSIAAAGRALQYTRSAVSQQLTALEAEAGTALVNRAGNRVTLTPMGRVLVDHAERILVEMRAAEATLAGADTEVAGLLRIGVPFREGPKIMSRALTDVRRRFPEIEMRLASTTDEAGPESVRRDQLDMVIISRYGDSHGRTAAGLREWVLGHDPLRLCVSSGHPLADAVSCTMDQLRDASWVMIPDSALGRLVSSMCAIAGFQPRVAATVDDVGTALGLVSMGWGVTVAPELTPAAGEGQVSRLRITGLDTVRHNVLVARDGEHLSPRLAAVISAVRAVAAELPGGQPSR